MSNKFTELPAWVINYNAQGHQSSAGKALKITIDSIDRLKQDRQDLITRLYNLMNAETPEEIAFRKAEALETLKKVIQ